MKPHVIDFYKEGYSKIEFCTICGAEGQTLRLECVGIEPDKNQMDLFKKDIDTDEERN